MPSLRQDGFPNPGWSHLRADGKSLLALFGGAYESDCLLVSLVWRMEQVSHEIFADGWYKVTRLIDILLFPRLRWHVWYFTDIDEVF